MTLDDIVRRFDAKSSGAGYMACCPAHEDDKASLSLSQKDGKVLLHCFTGCATEDILRAKSLTMKDLFVSSNGNGHHAKSPVVATYTYRDLHGEVRYRKQRTADKQFFFARPDGHGDWITSAKRNGGKPVMEGVERLLYRLNELHERSEGSSSDTFLVYIPEGEKDADRLWSLGLPATTNDVGASDDLHRPKWTEALTQQLKAIGVTTVVCLPDNDDPGRAHMQAVARSCMAMGIEARVVMLPGLPPKGDVTDYLDAGHTVAELVALCDAASVYVPPSIEEPPEPVTEPAVVVPYAFEHAFQPGHFVTTWIEHFSKQCDAALEYHEGAALVALAQATPSLTARISGSADGLRTNLYVLFVGRAGVTRKSTAKDYAVETLRRALPNVLLPEQMTQESFVESLTKCNNGAALWPIDEFTDTLSKMLNATFLAGMRGVLLEMYARTSYAYRRVSKTVKTKKKGDEEPVVERVEDFFYIENVTFSLIGCATDTLFRSLDNTAVGSGLLTRFAIIMPESKPARLPQYELIGEAIPNTFVTRLHEISLRTAKQTVTFAPGVLKRIDEAIDKPLDESADRCQMTVRMGVMARKVAMLSAAGRPSEFELENAPLVVTLDDADAAIRVVTRWIGYAEAFEARTDESAFEVTVQKCVAIIKGRTLNRRVIAQRVHVPAKELLEIERTLEQREQIAVIVNQPKTGRPSTSWRWTA